MWYSSITHNTSEPDTQSNIDTFIAPSLLIFMTPPSYFKY